MRAVAAKRCVLSAACSSTRQQAFAEIKSQKEKKESGSCLSLLRVVTELGVEG